MADVALQIRRNAQEYRDAVQDLLAWETQVSAQDKAASAKKPAGAAKSVPVRGASGPVNSKNRIKSSDYRAWDTFDVDKALEEIEYQPAPEAPSKDVQPTAMDDGTLEQALLYKEKGNAFFKKGDYKKAVASYGKAIGLDPSNPILLSNRAMAYLKLEKYAKADVDCSDALAMDPKNVKALFRRGMARMALAKLKEARDDLELAHVLDPMNKPVKAELDRVNDMLKPASAKPAPAAEPKPTAPLAPLSESKPALAEVATKRLQPTKPIRRRRVEIEEIGDPKDYKPVKSISREPVKVELAPAAEKSVVAKEPTKTNLAVAVTPLPDFSMSLPPAPTSLFEFERDWKSLKKSDDLLFEYLKSIDPSTYSKIFKTSLEAHYVSKILDILQTKFLGVESSQGIQNILQALANLPRFSMVSMFLSRKDREVATLLFKNLSSTEAAKDPFTKLAKAYGVTL